MEFFSVQINSLTFKTFRTLKLAQDFVSLNYQLETNDLVQIYHEEYPDYGHEFADSHGYKTLVWTNQK